MNFEPGQTIGDYEVLAVLGSGGMGKVYKVRNLISQRVEAMKVLLPDLNAHPDLLDRFVREIRISAGLDHPNIACLRSAQRAGDQLLMLMEFVEGTTLSTLMQQGRMALSATLSYMSQALAALEYAHSHNVIHRDIKPSNMMVTPAGQLKLMDFGVAKLSTDSKLTKTGLMVGSLHYLSPEQIEGKDPDARSDLYALGITFYELVTGKRPYDGDSEYQIMSAHLKGAALPPREMDPSVPAPVSDLVLTAMARNPEARFGSAKAMKTAVDNLAATLSQRNEATAPFAPAPQPVSPPPPPPVRARQGNRALYIVAGSLATIAVIVAAATVLPRYLHTHASTPAAEARSQPAAVQQQPPPAISQPAPQPTPGLQAPPQSVTATAADPQPASPPRISRRKGVETTLRQQTAKSAQAPAKAEPIVPAPASEPARQPQAQSAPVQQSAAAPDMTPLRDQLLQMRSRAAAAQNSLDNLQRAQAQSGFGLRTDIAASSQHLAALLSEADSRINAADSAGAQHYLDLAETELNKIEKFLGR